MAAIDSPTGPVTILGSRDETVMDGCPVGLCSSEMRLLTSTQGLECGASHEHQRCLETQQKANSGHTADLPGQKLQEPAEPGLIRPSE